MHLNAKKQGISGKKTPATTAIIKKIFCGKGSSILVKPRTVATITQV